ncbi:MAG TPA: hydrogenase maturation protease [Candidatus Wunengus sp. YC60]|uniref:hydrogenase maturation protease n=1 Tax=Candidatus Wunengus sp. YC60 TaxID=3367697 RepID=UPI0040288EF1
MNSYPILIIGIGNAFRGDDAVGLRVAQDIKKEAPDRVNVIVQNSDGAALMESWKNADTVILIDAVHSGGNFGTIYRFDVHTQPIPTEFFHYSTHAFGVAEAIELARALKQLPQNLIVYGIEGKCFEAGIGLSIEVERAAQEVVTRVRRDIQNVLPRKYTEYH